MSNQDDTQPKRPANFPPPPLSAPPQGVSAPPRILFYGVIGLFVLGVVGTLAGIYIFREVLPPRQQEHVMHYFGFMEAFLPPQPDADDTVPTALATVDQSDLDSLLNLDLPPAGGTPESADAAPTELPAITEATEELTQPPTPPPSATAAPTETPLPTAAPTQTATTAPTAAVSAPVQSVAATGPTWPVTSRNYGITRVEQTWNNCGPASITMALSFYGWQNGQEYAASYLKPSREDKNVSPAEIVDFVNSQSQVRALYRVGGDLDILRRLIAAEFPVIIERSHSFEGYQWLGHYQTLVGYNDSSRTFTIYDSFLESEIEGDDTIQDTYAEVDSHWQAFNRTFIVIYDPAREQRLMQVLGPLADTQEAAQVAFDAAQKEARANPTNGFAWFNMGSSLTLLGRYEEATRAYDQAFSIGVPWRMLWYQFGPFKAYYEVGRYEDVLSYVNNNLNNGGEYVEESYYWRGQVLAATGRTTEAIGAFRQALEHNRYYSDAQIALNALS